MQRNITNTIGHVALVGRIGEERKKTRHKMKEMRISKDDHKTGEQTQTERRTQKINEWYVLVHSIPLKSLDHLNN